MSDPELRPGQSILHPLIERLKFFGDDDGLLPENKIQFFHILRDLNTIANLLARPLDEVAMKIERDAALESERAMARRFQEQTNKLAQLDRMLEAARQAPMGAPPLTKPEVDAQAEELQAAHKHLHDARAEMTDLRQHKLRFESAVQAFKDWSGRSGYRAVEPITGNALVDAIRQMADTIDAQVSAERKRQEQEAPRLASNRIREHWDEAVETMEGWTAPGKPLEDLANDDLADNSLNGSISAMGHEIVRLRESSADQIQKADGFRRATEASLEVFTSEKHPKFIGVLPGLAHSRDGTPIAAGIYCMADEILRLRAEISQAAEKLPEPKKSIVDGIKTRVVLWERLEDAIQRLGNRSDPDGLNTLVKIVSLQIQLIAGMEESNDPPGLAEKVDAGAERRPKRG